MLCRHNSESESLKNEFNVYIFRCNNTFNTDIYCVMPMCLNKHKLIPVLFFCNYKKMHTQNMIWYSSQWTTRCSKRNNVLWCLYSNFTQISKQFPLLLFVFTFAFNLVILVHCTWDAFIFRPIVASTIKQIKCLAYHKVNSLDSQESKMT